MRAFVASRVIVLVAGTAGALAVPWQQEWWIFDPARISARLGSVGGVLAAPAVRWDAISYLLIASHGYRRPASTVFFPLYPLLVHIGGVIVGSYVLAGIAISVASGLAAMLLLHRLTDLELGRRAADATVLLLAFAPLSFFFTAVYTESLFLALSVGAIYAARRDRWALGACLAGLAALTRVTGVLLVLAMVILHFGSPRRLDRRLGWVLVVPAALFAYLGFLAANGFSWRAPFQEEAVWFRQATGPIDAGISAVAAALRGAGAVIHGVQPVYAPSLSGPLSRGAESIVLLLVLVIAVVTLVGCFRRLPLAYGAYAAAALLVCTSSPVGGQPLLSLDRYALTIFPIWMAAGAWAAERRLTCPAALLGGMLLAFYTFHVATWSFIA